MLQLALRSSPTVPVERCTTSSMNFLLSVSIDVRAAVVNFE